MSIQDDPIITSVELLILVIASAGVLLILLITVIVLYTVFQKRKIRFIVERNAAEKKYMEEVSKTTLEVQETTLRNVSWELHDNIGQLLSVAVMQLNIIKAEDCDLDKVEDVKKLLSTSLQEIRSLSKSLNKEVVSNIGLVESIENELDRFERLNFLKTRLKISGTPWPLDKNTSILVFRIIQEFLSNVVKHAKATHLYVSVEYNPEVFKIDIKDDGVGYDPTKPNQNSGMVNMRDRAVLLGASLTIESKPGAGTTMQLILPKPADEMIS